MDEECGDMGEKDTGLGKRRGSGLQGRGGWAFPANGFGDGDAAADHTSQRGTRHQIDSHISHICTPKGREGHQLAWAALGRTWGFSAVRLAS